MNNEKNKCAGCTQEIPGRQHLFCALCKNYYDLNCANVTEKYFYNIMPAERKQNWKCQACRCKIPKITNPNTPIKTLLLNNELADPNVTFRKKTINEHINISASDISIDDIAENTLLSQTIEKNASTTATTLTEDVGISTSLTLEQIGSLLDTKLERMKTCILSDVRSIIQDEINNSLKDFKNKIENDLNSKLIDSQKQFQEEIKNLNKKIMNIEEELYNLKNSKKIVLYGLMEGYSETENELVGRVSRLFHDILNINICPYIEEIKRLGRRGNRRRPIAIELISKRMSDFVINNTIKFKNTGLSIGKFVSGKTLEERKELIRNMKAARTNGQNAYIKNNKLYVDGKLYTNTCKSTTTNRTEGASISTKDVDIPESTPLTPMQYQEQSSPDTMPHNTTMRQQIGTFQKQFQ